MVRNERYSVPKIAFLACPDTLPGSPTRRPDAFEHDLLFDALNAGLAGRAELVALDWRAPLDELTRCDLAYLGTPWDYTEAKDEFLERLTALEVAGVVVFANEIQVGYDQAGRKQSPPLFAAGLFVARNNIDMNADHMIGSMVSA